MRSANLGGRSTDVRDEALFAGLILGLTTVETVDEGAALSLDDCERCDASGKVDSGRSFWSRSAGCYEAHLVRCPDCRGYGVLAVELPSVDLDALLAVDAASTAHLLDVAPVADAVHGGLLEALGATLLDAVHAVLVAAVHAAVDAAELRDREDERDGERVHAAGRDVSALVSTDAPVHVLTRPRREHRAAA